MSETSPARNIGLIGATGVGIGAIVGGGILVLAGVAYVHVGPGAVVAFALNGVVALITAASFAEMACAFPESGGAYTFAKKVLSVRAAFAVGWFLWIAYIVAGVLYALGFATYAVVALGELSRALGRNAPAWANADATVPLLAAAATAYFAWGLIRKATGGGQWATVGKLVVFGAIILAGAVALLRRPVATTTEALVPFFPGGATGLLAAMGFTFIALQGFDLIAAVGGEIRDPGRTIPRAMFLSLGAALVVYLPLLLLVAAVGVRPGESIRTLAAAQPETVMAVAVGRFMGSAGYWLVVIAAILSTLSALHANILAASRVALSMARDRTLPTVLGVVHPGRRTPAIAIYASALTLVAILFMVPDVAAAGAAASLIFLVTFALAQATAILARRRGGLVPGAFRTPWFPLFPVAGIVACGALAVFQAVVSPYATAIVAIWLGLGVILYFALFAARAETADASAEAFDPTLARLRGRNPLVLLPIANPARAASMVAVANALAPRDVGRVLLLTILPVPGEAAAEELELKFGYAQQVIQQALATAFADRRAPETLITSASVAWTEIGRVARLHRCESLLLGLGPLSQGGGERELARLVDESHSDVALMRAPVGWRLDQVRRVLVPVGGRGVQHGLRARLLGSLGRTNAPEVTFVRVLDRSTSEPELERTRREVERMARDKAPGGARVVVERGEDPAATILELAARHDLLVLGLPARGSSGRLLEGMARRLAHEAPCAAILLSSHR